jgi:hypothetical protein
MLWNILKFAGLNTFRGEYIANKTSYFFSSSKRFAGPSDVSVQKTHCNPPVSSEIHASRVCTHGMG